TKCNPSFNSAKLSAAKNATTARPSSSTTWNLTLPSQPKISRKPSSPLIKFVSSIPTNPPSPSSPVSSPPNPEHLHQVPIQKIPAATTSSILVLARWHC